VWLPTGSLALVRIARSFCANRSSAGRTNVPRRSLEQGGALPLATRAATLRRRIRVGWHGKVRHVSSSALDWIRASQMLGILP